MPQQSNITTLGKYDTVKRNFSRVAHGLWTKEGHLVVVERGGHRVQIFDEKLQFVRSFGKYGWVKGHFKLPHAACTGKGGLSHLLFIADTGNDRVVVMNVQGEFVRSFPCPEPHGVCVDAKNNLYVSRWSDYNHDIGRYSDVHIAVMDKDGQPLRKIGSKDQQEPRLDEPDHLCVSDEHGQLFIVDSHHHRVVVTSLEGRLLHSFGTKGQGPRQFNYPQGICLSQDNKLFIGDRWNNRVVCYGWDGVSERFLGSTGAEAEFKWTGGVSIDSRHRLAVADWHNHRVVVVKDFTPSRVPFLMCLFQ